MKTSALQGKLRENKLKITPQRLEVLRAIQQLQNHPSAEAIYQTVKRKHPSMSLATVYKTLETLVDIGEIRVALVSNGKARYDIRVDRHHHFLCTHCGKLEDVDMHLDCLSTCFPSTLKNYQVTRSEVVFQGYCPPCAEKIQTQTTPN